jgi:hypothetical protein
MREKSPQKKGLFNTVNVSVQHIVQKSAGFLNVSHENVLQKYTNLLAKLSKNRGKQ